MPQVVHVESEERLEELFAQSAERPVWLFKHSLSCPISTRAWGEFQQFAKHGDDEVVYAMLPIQRARPLSAAVAERTGVKHESPQALLLKDGEVLWHASHNGIQLDTLRSAAE